MTRRHPLPSARKACPRVTFCDQYLWRLRATGNGKEGVTCATTIASGSEKDGGAHRINIYIASTFTQLGCVPTCWKWGSLFNITKNSFVNLVEGNDQTTFVVKTMRKVTSRKIESARNEIQIQLRTLRFRCPESFRRLYTTHR